MVAYHQWLSHRRLTKTMNNCLEKLGPTRGRDVGLQASHIGEVNDTQEVRFLFT